VYFLLGGQGESRYLKFLVLVIFSFLSSLALFLGKLTSSQKARWLFSPEFFQPLPPLFRRVFGEPVNSSLPFSPLPMDFLPVMNPPFGRSSYAATGFPLPTDGDTFPFLSYSPVSASNPFVAALCFHFCAIAPPLRKQRDGTLFTAINSFLHYLSWLVPLSYFTILTNLFFSSIFCT